MRVVYFTVEFNLSLYEFNLMLGGDVLQADYFYGIIAICCSMNSELYNSKRTVS
jgi:hypothetical protein